MSCDKIMYLAGEGLEFNYYMGHNSRKTVFGVSDKASFKPVSSATETSEKIEISPVASVQILLFKK